MKKLMRICIMTGFILLCSPHIEAKTISGGIYTDTTWTAAEGPYTITGDVVLFPGYTLTIEPGVTVQFNSNTSLKIRGTLNATGTASERINFVSTNSSNNWSGIYLHTDLGGKGVIKYANLCNATTALSVNLGGVIDPAIIENCTFANNTVALGGYAGNDMVVRNSTFENNIYTITSADKEIYNCIFRNNQYGLYQTERISVHSSTFEDNQIALYGGRGVVDGCIISNNATGIKPFYEGFALSYNTIMNNDVGVILGDYDGHTPSVQYNNICNNDSYNLQNSTITDKYAPNNWWGTTDPSAISAKIYDGYDNLNLGLVYFEPILTQPIPEPATICMLGLGALSLIRRNNSHK